MTTALLVTSVLAPLAAAFMAFAPRLGRVWVGAFLAAPLPALLLGLGVTETHVVFPDIFLVAELGYDGVGRAFLVLTATLWLVAGVYACGVFTNPSHLRRYGFFHLVTYVGNVGAVLSLDAATFYVFYAIMTVGGYGLVNHSRTQRAESAGRFYLSFALFGEMLVFSAIMLALDPNAPIDFATLHKSVGGAKGDWIIGLFFVGFGMKVGLVPLHAWLPRSYYAAPIPAVAVLSGVMSKAGVLGWLRFIPLGISEFWGAVILTSGIITALYGAFVGVVQTRARSALAFSSLSQMGYFAIILGAGLEAGAPKIATFAAATAYAWHHGLVKVALFLGVDLLAAQSFDRKRRLVVLAALFVACASLVGLPFTSGAYAKALLKAIGGADGTWRGIASVVLTAGSLATLLLMTRFFVLSVRLHGNRAVRVSQWCAWGVVVAASSAAGWCGPAVLRAFGLGGSAVSAWATLVSVAPALVLAVPATYGLRRVLWRESSFTPRPLEGIIGRTRWAFGAALPGLIQRAASRFARDLRAAIALLHIPARAERIVNRAAALTTSWALGIALFLGIGLALGALLARGGPG